MTDDDEKPTSLLREKEYAIAEYFHQQMLEKSEGDIEALEELSEVHPDEILESMRFCQDCDEEIYSIEEQRRLTLEYDEPSSTAREIYMSIADHMNNRCAVRKSKGAPPVAPPQENAEKMYRAVSAILSFLVPLTLVVFVPIMLFMGVVSWIRTTGIVLPLLVSIWFVYCLYALPRVIVYFKSN